VRGALVVLASCLCGACDRGRTPPSPPLQEAATASAPVAPSQVEEAASVAPIAVEASSPPPVTVENIGMHIGGGPNDAETKAPIGGSVAPHFAELADCWSQLADPKRAGDFGVDLLIPREGGIAIVSHPRTSLAPDAFRDCVVGVFGRIEFSRPRTGKTTVSYSLRFTPTPATAQ
jgi:hypothetical protein